MYFVLNLDINFTDIKLIYDTFLSVLKVGEEMLLFLNVFIIFIFAEASHFLPLVLQYA